MEDEETLIKGTFRHIHSAEEARARIFFINMKFNLESKCDYFRFTDFVQLVFFIPSSYSTMKLLLIT